MLLCVSPIQPKPFNTNINTNYNNNYDTNLNASYLISSLLNYILNLLQILQRNGESTGSGPFAIPAFPRPGELPNILKQYPPTPIQQQMDSPVDTKSLAPSSGDGSTFKQDFSTLYSHVFDHLVKNKNSGMDMEGIHNSVDGSYDYKKAVEEAVGAFRGQPVPPLLSPVPLSPPHQVTAVEEPPELKAAKMEFLRAFAEAQARAVKKPDV